MRTISLPANSAPVLVEVGAERIQQDVKWGQQDHEDGTGYEYLREQADRARRECDAAFAAGVGTWRHILREEYREAVACSDPAELRAELVQVAAVCVAWIEAIDRREGRPAAEGMLPDYFVAPDAHDVPTVWRQTDAEPVAVLTRDELRHTPDLWVALVGLVRAA